LEQGIDTITPQEVRSIKLKLKKVYLENRRKDLLMKWNKRLKSELKEGLWSDDELLVVQGYFTAQILENSNRMKKYMKELNSNKRGLRVEQFFEEKREVEKIEKVFNKRVWAEYRQVTLRNKKK
jgi:hypothetical protein